MTHQCTPADIVFAMLGGRPSVAVVCGLHEKSAYIWDRPSKDRDAGDIPSARHMRKLLSYARENGIPLTAEHLIFGCTRQDLDALMAELQSRAATPARVAAE